MDSIVYLMKLRIRFISSSRTRLALDVTFSFRIIPWATFFTRIFKFIGPTWTKDFAIAIGIDIIQIYAKKERICDWGIKKYSKMRTSTKWKNRWFLVNVIWWINIVRNLTYWCKRKILDDYCRVWSFKLPISPSYRNHSIFKEYLEILCINFLIAIKLFRLCPDFRSQIECINISKSITIDMEPNII